MSWMFGEGCGVPEALEAPFKAFCTSDAEISNDLVKMFFYEHTKSSQILNIVHSVVLIESFQLQIIQVI